MAFPSDLLGPVAGRLQGCCDLDGRVPETGDNWTDLRWDRRMRSRFEQPDQWALFVKAAMVETGRAWRELQSLENWS